MTIPKITAKAATIAKKRVMNEFPTINDFVIGKAAKSVSKKTEMQIIKHMEKFAEQRIVEEFEAIQEGKKIILNA